MSNFKFGLMVLALVLAPALATAGTILLLGAGTGAPGGAGPSCSDSLDFSDGCNSQYLPAVF